MDRLEVLALDLEGTLISDVLSRTARPGLYEFLEFCRKAVPRVVIYTSVAEGHVREIAAELIADGAAPRWFETIEYIQWSTRRKDLAAIHGATIARTILVDDYEGAVVRDQRRQWLRIKSFSEPCVSKDDELRRIRRVLEDEWGCRAC